MITILEKDGGFIITVSPAEDNERLSTEERELVKSAKTLKQKLESDSPKPKVSAWEKWRKKKAAEAETNTVEQPSQTNEQNHIQSLPKTSEGYLDLNDFEEILGADDLPF